MSASLQECWDLEAKLRPGFDALVSEMNLTALKVFARTVGANTRGAMVKADYLRAVEQRWRSEVWDIAGYRYGVRPRRVFYPDLLALPEEK